ncbi:MAG: hypothetical protein Ctma_1376 [Catillopecten margaritatus gill symbiont]|uniref:Uncharacterized protein n=1 Tax=Catillopecten margaritatus gill symbiont TaxID=3083288 RepID=A0AAU6PI15_9GAMM
MTTPSARLLTILYFAMCYGIALQFGDAMAVIPLALILSFVLIPTFFVIAPIFEILKRFLTKSPSLPN